MKDTTVTINGFEIFGASPDHFVTPKNGIGIGLAEDTKSEFGRVLVHPIFAVNRKHPLDWKAGWHLATFCLN